MFEQLTNQLIIGGVLILITFILQAAAFDLIMRKVRWLEKISFSKFRLVWKTITFTSVITAICCTIIIEIWIWALFYLYMGIFPDLEAALYFSTTSFTTVGYGDLYLEKDWRLLSSIESMNGFMLFGWATAFIWEIITKVYNKSIHWKPKTSRHLAKKRHKR